MKGTILYILFLVCLLRLGMLTIGCANIVPPEGGPRDTLPPNLLESTPVDSTVGFKGNRITLTFDEFVKLDNAFTNVMVSPVPKMQPDIRSRLNTVTIRLRDSLEANTTYSINFGNAIVDVNENNPLHNFTYIFSTGPTLDSLTFSGKVIMAETGELDTTLIVMLHTTNRDSALINEKPRYVTRLNAAGNFTFRNLPADSFYVYALKDESRSYRYLNKTVPFAFADSGIMVSDSTSPLTLYAYSETKPASTTAAGATSTGEKRLRYTTSVNPDNSHDLLKPFRFTFETPLRRFDSSKVRFASDTLFTPIETHTWSIDSSKKLVALNHTWAEGMLYHLILEKDFATDTLGLELLKADTISFTTKTSADYGPLTLRFRNLDLSVNPVLQFVQNGQVLSSHSLTAEVFSQSLFTPGDYQLRILHDANRNGVWDPGRFYGVRRQPEFVRPIEKQITVKANARADYEIVL